MNTSEKWVLVLLLAFLLPAGAGEAPASADQSLTRAREAMRAGQWKEAETWIQRALDLEAEARRGAIYALRGQLRALTLDPTNAVADFDRALKLDPASAPLYQWRGAERFKLGRIEDSITDFDEFLRREPGQEPHHWQRGIAYYYAGRYEDGRRQFELHQTVNPRDVENAVWHFMCVAAVSGADRARERFIAITGDSRVPMREIHALFAGRAGVEEVWKAVDAGEVTPGQRQTRRFYAHLYLGLYHEARKEKDLAKEQILKAAELSDGQNYMGAVARVHAMRLREGSPKR